MKKGYGRATIAVGPDSVVKFGPGAREQAFYMIGLRTSVCPKVLDIFQNGYVMERLDEPQEKKNFNWAELVLNDIFNLLESEVWNTRVNLSYSWPKELERWSAAVGLHGCGKMFDRLYPSKVLPLIGGHAIHGDPTMANVLFERGTTSLVIADPIPPAGKIPSLVEVDLAKIAQSVIGWEHVAHGWPLFGEKLVNEYMRRLGDIVRGTPSSQQKIKFWLMVHLYRILPYVQGDQRIKTWALNNANYIFKNMEEPLCDTLMTLMERSRSRKKRSTPRTSR